MQDTYATSAVSRVAASTSPSTLDAADQTRAALLVYNEPGSGTAYVKLGTSPTTTSYTVAVPAGSLVNVASLDDGKTWIGDVTVVWSSAVGNAQVTKVTR